MRKKKAQKKFSYSDEFKEQVAKEICDGKIAWRDAQIKYGISSQGTLGRWVKKFKNGWVSLSTKDNTVNLKKEDLSSLVVQLKKQLRHAQTRNVVYEAIINNAEKELRVDIRKKSFTKRSKK